MSRPADIKTQFLEFYENADIERLREIVVNYPNIWHDLCLWGLPEALLCMLTEHRIISWMYLKCCGARYNSMDLINLAVAHGADEWSLPLRYACGGGNMDMIRYIHAQCPTVNLTACLNEAGYSGHLQVVQYILERGINIEATQSLPWICMGGNVEILKLVISKYPDVLTSLYSHILSYASSSRRIEMVQFVLQLHPAGYFDLNDALMYACRDDQIEMIKLLLEKGANSAEHLTESHIRMLLNIDLTVVYFNKLQETFPSFWEEFKRIRVMRAHQHAVIYEYLPKALIPGVLDYLGYADVV